MPSEFNEKIIEEFRANGGLVGGHFQGSSLVLLSTTGAKSGRRVTTPVMYVRDGDRVVIIASNAGADSHPAWYHNLLANPDVTVELGTETFAATSELIEGDERDRLYAEMVAIAPTFADYEAKTARRIPVVALNRAT
ncbi:nitroreductase family deazaflavin-dependent oxidoreductase [Nonomuraea sp. bgisy101]|uniref:nitroreductase family deazaflavin-dependent oxidoreductase n=1 Tax=Nonomuraea sp. bgisy101 TaxID=3413784 RepID=UPI003D7300AD